MFAKQLINNLYLNTHNFFFDDVNIKRAKIFTSLLSVLTLLNLLVFYSNYLDYFSSSGVFSSQLIKSTRSTSGWSIFFLNDSPQFVTATYYFSIVLCVLLIFSVLPRTCCFLLWVIMFSLYNRNSLVFNAGNIFLNFMLFCGIFINHKQPKAYPFRFIQIQFCIIYFFAFMSKTSSYGWMVGEYVFWMSNFPGRGYWDTVVFFQRNQILANLANYFVLSVELSFPFLVWFSKLTIPMVLLSFMLHLGVDLSINTVYFSQVMWVGLVAFMVNKNSTIIKDQL